MTTTQVLWAHEVQYAPRARSASEARAFVELHLTKHRLGYLVAEIQLVVSELVTNAVVHARTPMTVTLEELLFCVKLTVEDDSPASPAPRVAAVGELTGRGLQVVEQLSSGWGYGPGREGSKVVWALFPVRPEQPPN